MFSFLLEERKITQWRFGFVSYILYPLDQVDVEFREEVKERIKGHMNKVILFSFLVLFFVFMKIFI